MDFSSSILIFIKSGFEIDVNAQPLMDLILFFLDLCLARYLTIELFHDLQSLFFNAYRLFY